MPPRKGKREVDTPPQGRPNEGKSQDGCEALRQGERIVEATPQKGKCKPEAFPQEGERRPKALSQGSPDEVVHEQDWSPRELSREGRPVLLGGSRPLGSWKEANWRANFQSRKGLLRPTETTQLASTNATMQQEKCWPCKGQVSQTAPA